MPDYTLYGLQSNPYKTKELDPLQYPGHTSQLVKSVDGFLSLSKVDSYLEGAVANNQPAFVLISGKSGAGRSSVANWVLSRYRELRGIEANRFIVPPRKVDNFDEFDVFRKWFAFLRSDITRKNYITLTPALSEELLKQLREAVRELMTPNFNDLAWKVSESLAAQEFPPGKRNPSGFGVCLENIQKYDIVRAALDIFKDVPTVGVFTTLDYDNIGKEVAALFRQQAVTPEQVVVLNPLEAEEISAFVKERWQKSSTFPDQLPFSPSDVGQKLGRPHRSLARVLSLMAGLIDLKLAEHRLGPAWPRNQNLRLTIEQIEQHIATLEGAYHE